MGCRELLDHKHRKKKGPGRWNKSEELANMVASKLVGAGRRGWIAESRATL